MVWLLQLSAGYSGQNCLKLSRTFLGIASKGFMQSNVGNMVIVWNVVSFAEQASLGPIEWAFLCSC